jgi:predicted nucleotidyltransferase
MEKWETALQKFIKKWENRKEVTGAIVCGSYVTGNPGSHSDIDVHIILDSGTSWRERGNEIIDGFLIEYFANPARQHDLYAEEDYKSGKRINAHMFCTGRVLFDKTGELKKLVEDSGNYLEKEFPGLSDIEIESAKYHIWDACDNLEEIFESGSEDFFFIFYNDLKDLFETYAKFLQYESIAVHKLRRFLV